MPVFLFRTSLFFIEFLVGFCMLFRKRASILLFSFIERFLFVLLYGSYISTDKKQARILTKCKVKCVFLSLKNCI